jgi:hypothetical protein
VQLTISNLGDQIARIEFYGSNSFIDISTITDLCHLQSLKIENMGAFGYWAVVKQPGNTCSPHAIVIFPSKEWFDEWREQTGPEIVFEEGRPTTKSTVIVGEKGGARA